MNPIECSACSELLLGFCWQRSFAFMSMSTCVCEGVCERNDINSTIVCDKPFATHTSVHTHTLECPPLTPSYTLPTVPYIPRELHTHSFRHANPPRDFLFLFFTCVFSSTFTVIKAYIASAPKWFVTICVDTGILFPLWMCCLDSALCCGSIHMTGVAFIFADNLSVCKSRGYCTP